ncbi:Hypothetical protein EAG7_02638 [Klebsiella aerogenes]|nr:Hypothetical protein EAG7_02638 [Klebsiella aerogenes]
MPLLAAFALGLQWLKIKKRGKSHAFFMAEIIQSLITSLYPG